ncbi:MAG: Holliday junction resolvase RuvX [bacterium]
MRYLGIDFGLKRIGFSISDENRRIAFGLTTIEGYKMKDLISYIKELVVRYRVEKIVVGFPKNMNGTPGVLSKDIYNFIEKIKGAIGDVEIILWDERLTTLQGERIQKEMKKKRKRIIVDEIAATLILQSYLDYRNRFDG